MSKAPSATPRPKVSSTLRSLAACSTSSAKANGERPCSSPSQEPSPHQTRKADHEMQDACGARDGRQRGGQEIAARHQPRHRRLLLPSAAVPRLQRPGFALCPEGRSERACPNRRRACHEGHRPARARDQRRSRRGKSAKARRHRPRRLHQLLLRQSGAHQGRRRVPRRDEGLVHPPLSVASPCKPCPPTSWPTRPAGWNRKPSRPPTGCRSTTSPCSTIESTALKAPWRTSCSPWSGSMTEGRHPA